MNDHLIIRLTHGVQDSSTSVDWCLYDDSGHMVLTDSHPLADVRSQIQVDTDNLEVSVLVPGSEFLIAPVQIPSRNPKQVKQALPFMVEELIADDIESVHISIPARLDPDSARVDCALVSHRVLIDWLDLFHSHQLSPSALYVDALSLPIANNAITIFVDGDQLLLRTMDFSALCLPVAEFEVLFGAFLMSHDHAGDPLLRPRIDIMYSADDEQAEATVAIVQDVLTKQFADYETKLTRFQESVTAVLAANIVAAGSPLLNILQGGYAVSRGNSNGWLQWRVAASVAAVGLLSYLLVTLGTGWYFSSQAEAFDKEAKAIYRQLFPNERRIVSPKKQMQNHMRLANVSANAHFLELLAQTAEQLEPESTRDLKIEQLRFNADKSGLQFQLLSSSISELEKFQQQLASAGLNVNINSAVERDDQVLGQMVVGAVQ